MNQTVENIKNECIRLGSKPPTGLKRNQLIYYKQMLDYSIANNIQLTTNIPKKKMIPTENWVGNSDIELYYQPIVRDKNIDWVEHFYTHGWTTVKVPNFDINGTTNEFIKWIESMDNNFNRYNTNTWNNTPKRFNGIFKHYIGHEEFMWQTREAVYPLFSQLWNDNNLISSFDGACFMNNNNNKHKSWFHWDHSRWVGNNSTVQGFVNLLDNSSLDGGLVLLEGSHLVYDNYLARHPLEGHSPYFFVDITDPLLSICRPIKICADAGELVLWNSKMTHCNVTPHNTNSARMCIYVSMQKRIAATQDELNKRIKAAENGRMTGHWCYGSDFNVNSVHPNWSNNDYKPQYIARPKLNPLRMKLIGY